MTVKKLLARFLSHLARARGYEIVANWRMDSLPLVKHLQNVFAAYNIDCVINVGANKGQFHDLLRQEVGFQGRILSFEPVRKYADALEAEARNDALWRVFPYALGSTTGETTINVTKSPGLNSILEPRTDAVPGFWNEGGVTDIETIMVKSLDEVLRINGLDCKLDSAYLKLDTQGFDLEVLKGASTALKSIPALQTEASIRPIYVGMPDYKECINYLVGKGFQISGLFPVTHDDAFRLIEFDCVMINERYANLRDRASGN